MECVEFSSQDVGSATESAGGGVRVATIRAGALDGLTAVLAQRGINFNLLCEWCGLEPALLAQPEQRIDVARYLQVLNRAATLTEDFAFGAALGYAQSQCQCGGPLSSLGLLGEIVQGTPTIGEAVHAVSRCIFMHQEGARLHICMSGSKAIVAYEPGAVARDGHESESALWFQDVQLALAKMVGFTRQVLGDQNWAPLEVHLRQPQIKSSNEQRRKVDRSLQFLFGAPVRFAAEHNALIFPCALLDRRIPPLLGTQAPNLITEQPEALIAWLQAEILRQLEVGAPSASAVAARLGIGERSLQRRLQAHGMAFNVLVEQVRHGLACRLLLEPSISLTEISGKLGYSEQSAFSRAFRRWAGCSPANYRSVHARLADVTKPSAAAYPRRRQNARSCPVVGKCQGAAQACR